MTTLADDAFRELNAMDDASLRAVALGMLLTALDAGERAQVCTMLAHSAALMASMTDATVSEVLNEWYARHEIEAHLETTGE